MTALTKAGLPRRRVGHHATGEERILLHTDRSGDCWLWTGCVDKRSGYGRLTIGRKSGLYSHRVSYETFVGDIPPGMQIDHLCRVRACCNPFHLEAVTPQVNTLRGDGAGPRARTRPLCLYGHSYAEHGVIRCGRRICRLCQNTYMRLYNAVDYAEAMRRKREGEKVVDLGAYFSTTRQEEVAA